MKQFFEQYGGVALGILAVLVLIAMITPVGNIIKTSLQGVAEKFSTKIGAQTDTALEGAAYAQGFAVKDTVLVSSNEGSYTLSCRIDNSDIERYKISANELADGVPDTDIYFDYMSKECSVAEMKGVIHYSTTKEGLEGLGMSIYHWEGGSWVLVEGDDTTKQSTSLPEVTGFINYNGQDYELKYTLAFNSNGGTAVGSQNVSRIPNSLPTSSKTGFTFAGWYTKSDLSQAAVSNTKLTEDTTLYAKWNLANYSITYNLNGGTLSGQKTSYTINDSTYALPTPTKDGSTFGGWYNNSSFTGSPITIISAGSTGNKELYAKWETGPAISLTKGQIVTMAELGLTDVDANADSTTDTFRVLSVDGTNVKLLAMDLYKNAYFNNAEVSTYAGSILDNEMTNYYNELPADVKSAIVAQNIVQSVYSFSNPISAPISVANKNSETAIGERYVYALDIDDVISYLGDSYTAVPCVALNQMFFGDDAGERVSRVVWLRSAFADDTDCVFNVEGYDGRMGAVLVSFTYYEVRPAFVLDLSLLS